MMTCCHFFSKVIYLIAFVSHLILQVFGGCCNEGYWCDGDPRFLLQPSVSQELNDPHIIISWSDTYIHQPKCVDFFYVEYKKDVAEGNENKFRKVAVRFSRLTELEDWNDPITKLDLKYHYWANISVEFSTPYTIRVAAVDKGSGWGNNEGAVVAFSKDIHFITRPFLNDSMLLAIEIARNREALEAKYPPGQCNQTMLCDELALDWIWDVGSTVINETCRYHDPEILPTIDLNKAIDESNRRTYFHGRLSNLGAAKIHSAKAKSVGSDSVQLELSFGVRLLKISYFWDSFFTSGILRLYHTCGKELPLTIFDDVDEDEVEELVDENCQVFINVTVVALRKVLPLLNIPKGPNAVLKESKLNAKVTGITVSLRKDQFEYDTTWFTKYFHDLDALFLAQRKLARRRIVDIFQAGFDQALKRVYLNEWLRIKYDIA